MEIKNRIDYLKALTQYEIVKSSKKGSEFHEMKMKLVNDISEYENREWQEFFHDIAIITALANRYNEKRNIDAESSKRLSTEAYVQGWIDAKNDIRQ